MLKSTLPILPCLKYMKNPVLADPNPAPSFLYIIEKLLEGTGGSSYKKSSPKNVAGTSSKGIVIPLIFLVKLNSGISLFVVANLYCSVAIFPIVPDRIGLPNF